MFMAPERARFSLLLSPLMKLKIPFSSSLKSLWANAMENHGLHGSALLLSQRYKDLPIPHNLSIFLGAVAMAMSGKTASLAPLRR